MLWLTFFIYFVITNSKNITCFNDCFYNNTKFYQGQYTWIVEEDAQCYCNNGTWIDCD
jgi:hypothetical protein